MLAGDEGRPTGPERLGFGYDKADVLRAFLHLAGQVQCSGNHKIWICPSDLNFGIESSDIELGCCHGLLPDLETFPQSIDFYQQEGQRSME